jgi:hypothetical protein
MAINAQSTRARLCADSPWFSRPLFLLALAAGLIAFVVQSGELGTSDTQHRLNATHALWTSSPPVFPDEYPEFGEHGRGGKLQTWYGIGQSLLMLPQDIIGTAIEHLPVFAGYQDDPSVRNIFVSYTTNILLAVLTALVCFRFLQQLGFSVNQAIAGVLALLLCTTHLHYTQNLMENNYIFLLTLAGFSFQFEWLQTGSGRALFWGSAAFGLNLLTRLTTGVDIIAGGIFVLLVLWWEKQRGPDLRRRCRAYLATALPIYIFFGLIDRAYQFYRFGSFFNTYISVVTKEERLRDPSLPLNYPFSTPLHVGFFGALFAPEKSIFLFDPLLILAILVAVIGWRRFSPAVRAYAITTLTMLLAYMCFYGRYFAWAGDFAWGDRYVSTSVELATLLAVPLLLRYAQELGRFVWGIGVFLIAISAVVQAASLAFWLPLEIYQMQTLGHPTFVIALRIKNIVAFALGKMDAWGLNNHAMTEDPWDYVHITTWNFLPCLLRRVGVAPAWVVHVAFAVWYAGLAALFATLTRLWIVTKRLGAATFLQPD